MPISCPSAAPSKIISKKFYNFSCNAISPVVYSLDPQTNNGKAKNLKKILLALGLVAVIVSCKEENKVVVPEAPKVEMPKVPEVKVEVPKVEIK